MIYFYFKGDFCQLLLNIELSVHFNSVMTIFFIWSTFFTMAFHSRQTAPQNDFSFNDLVNLLIGRSLVFTHIIQDDLGH